MPGNGSALIKLAAIESGFDLCGIAVAEPGGEDAHLAAWLGHGYHGDMKYMERRRDVRELLDGCRSVIALAVNYHVDHQHGDGPRVSRYAWGEDYHRILGRKLEQLRERLERLLPDDSFRSYCDTGPIMEKAWAQRAGIGWIGKNGCLISQRFGSWVFLAVVLTTAQLEPDAPHADRCGSCERCLSACPTDAFVSPGVIDARKCIPYLTIEQWRPIEAKIEPWVFGCDACQEVCPWNSKAKAQAEFGPRPGQDVPDLRNWIRMRGPEFRATYGDTALARPGRRGLARNALAFGGIDEETLAMAREDASALVREQAALHAKPAQ
ncbi:MAG: tRNA epoxyqueuosine(34) reductase QueG [Planctomycetota bacterium]|jgi:epoxyqueuosine reductase